MISKDVMIDRKQTLRECCTVMNDLLGSSTANVLFVVHSFMVTLSHLNSFSCKESYDLHQCSIKLQFSYLPTAELFFVIKLNLASMVRFTKTVMCLRN